MVDKVAVNAAIREVYVPIRDTGDEAMLLEYLWPVFFRVETANLSKRRAEVQNNKPLRRAVLRSLDLVQRIVIVLEIRAVEEHEHDQQSLVRGRADERVLAP